VRKTALVPEIKPDVDGLDQLLEPRHE